jgi:hypothetical protein
MMCILYEQEKWHRCTFLSPDGKIEDDFRFFTIQPAGQKGNPVMNLGISQTGKQEEEPQGNMLDNLINVTVHTLIES